MELYQEKTKSDGVVRLMKYPEGYQLWYHGECVWRSERPYDKARAIVCEEWQYAVKQYKLEPGTVTERLASAIIQRFDSAR